MSVSGLLDLIGDLIESSAASAGDPRWSEAVTRMHAAADRLRRGV